MGESGVEEVGQSHSSITMEEAWDGKDWTQGDPLRDYCIKVGSEGVLELRQQPWE